MADTGGPVPKNVLVLGMDEHNRRVLEAMPDAAGYRFHALLGAEEMLMQEQIPFAELLDRAQQRVDEFDGTVDAIIGFWDFPVSTMVPILCERAGLPGASLESVVKCEHKYWSRLEQQAVIDEYPRFGLLQLTDAPELPEGVGYPAWVKPVKSASSELAYRVADGDELAQAVARIRAGIERMGEPFGYVLDMLDPPPEIAQAGGDAALAEEAVTGVQATVEGYAFDGGIHVYGVVDSVTCPGSPSFERYRYPSTLPDEVTDRMTEVSRRVIERVGLTDGTFNIEFFWDRDRDTLTLLEVNPRHSQSHAELFADVDGLPNHHSLVQIALGRDPGTPSREGDYAISAKWFVRRFTDGIVRRVPTADEIARAEREVPGCSVDVAVEPGDRLSTLHDQDGYSYAYAYVHVGGADDEDVAQRYRRCLEVLPFEFEDVDGDDVQGDAR
ncbi:ATP-grasp domain-containing protein [Pseudonocardia sp.]|uniref:ATP-grasp domain-containing protein n=1 Tax=Pseudonocardia sp. TaxID=60912 RepID=UPI0026153A8E|nr:ATP-grasp domain-containing protein [Pseudonocardia sp.]